MEKFSSIDRVVGNAPEEKKNAFLLRMKKVFEDHDIEKLKESEHEKSPEELKVLEMVNDDTNALRRKYGLEDFNVPPENISIIKKDIWDKEGLSGSFFPDFQRAMIGEKTRLIRLAKTAFHETVHFKNYGAFQTPTDAPDSIIEYRCGIMTAPRSIEKIKSRNGAGDLAYFRDLNEAITEECARRWLLSRLDEPIFQKEVEETRQLKEAAIANNDTDWLNDDIYDLEISPDDPNKLTKGEFSYPDYRAALLQIIHAIYAKNPGKFANEDEVFDVFARAAFTGHMMEMARLMEHTFGKGTMRKIAEP